MQKLLSGIMPPIVTPFVNGELSAEKLAANIEKWNRTGLAGYVVMGSNGESAFLTRDEKLLLVESVKNAASPGKLVIAGTGCDSIKETISLTNDAAGRGADFALILTPSFFKSAMKHAAFVQYFKAVADAVKIPVIIYNVPKFTGVDIDVETVTALAAHGNIVGIKNSSENARQLIEFAAATPDDFSVLAGTASMLYSAFTTGCDGGVLALANIAPAECIAIQQAVQSGDLKTGLEIQRRMIPVNKAITATYGVPGLKYAMDMLGYYGGLPRLPLSSLGEAEKLQLKEILITAGLLPA